MPAVPARNGSYQVGLDTECAILELAGNLLVSQEDAWFLFEVNVMFATAINVLVVGMN